MESELPAQENQCCAWWAEPGTGRLEFKSLFSYEASNPWAKQLLISWHNLSPGWPELRLTEIPNL